VGTSLEAGVAVLNCFDRERDQATGNFRKVLSEIRDELAVGETLADAVAHQGEQFPQLYCEMLRAGEETGHTGRLMLRMATHYEKLIQLRRVVFSALVMPGLQLMFALGVVGLLIWIVGVINTGSGEPVDILGLGLVGNRGLLIYFMVLGGIALGLLGLITEWRRGRMGANTAIELLMKLPAVGSFIETAALARMAWALSMTTGAGMDARRSMRTALQCTNMHHYEKHAAAIDASIKAGHRLHEALSDTHAFSAEFIGVVEVGEQSGRLSESLEHLFQQYEDRADALASGLATAATFAVWALVAGFIVFLIFRVASFYLATINSFLP
jgi:type IV pilus assembly protein PilC